MYPLLICSTLAIAIIIERIYQFIGLTKRKKNFLVNLENETISNYEMQERGAQKIVLDMEKNLNFLSIIANLSVLLGLLGTVVGLIGAFIAVENYGRRTTPHVLASGIWQALLTTAYGLGIAIVSSAFYYFFEHKISSFEKHYNTLIKIKKITNSTNDKK